MKVFGLQRGFYQIWRLDVQELSPLGRERLRLLRVWETWKGMDSFEASEVLGVPVEGS